MRIKNWFKNLTGIALMMTLLVPALTGAVSDLDQVNSNGLTGYDYIKGHTPIGQTFTPAKNMLNKIGVYVCACGEATTLTLDLWVSEPSRQQLILQDMSLPNGSPQWVYFDFPAQFVKTGALVDFYLSSTSALTYWKGGGNNYSGGTAIKDNPNWAQNQDFGFATYGYNILLIPIPTIPTTTAPPVTPTTVATPAQTTSSEIKAPTELKATDVNPDEGGSLRLDWKPSATTDITGYKVLKSVFADKDFGEIGTIAKGTASYTDNVATTGQKFYYQVRAYKNTTQSASSNTVSGTSLDNVAPAKPKNFDLTTASEKSLTFTWDKNTEKDLKEYVLSIFDPSKKDEPAIELVQVSKDLNKVELDLSKHEKLKVATEYSFTLQAKDTHNNLSEKTSALKAKFSLDQKINIAAKKSSWTDNLWYYILGGGLILVFGLSVLLYYLLHKEKKSNKKATKEKEE